MARGGRARARVSAAAGPPAATSTVRTYASRLRRGLDRGAARQRDQLIQSAGDGYRLRPDAVQLDLTTFERRVHGADAARDRQDTAASARLLREALGLWQGAALAGVPGPHADSQRALLAELRLAAAEEKLVLEISLGAHARAAAELRALHQRVLQADRHLMDVPGPARWNAGDVFGVAG